MTNIHRPISFNSFYLSEFFNKTIGKSKDIISPENFEKLKELSRYLVGSEDIISGLEKLAQYQGTNEFAIFLFDMIDHIDDYSPMIVYDTLPDLVEDFVNLYSLMIEDQESVEAVDNVINLFKESEPLPQEESPEEKAEIPKDDAEILESAADEIEDVKEEPPAAENKEEVQEELLTLKEFYFKHVQLVLDKKFESLEAEKRTNYREVVNIFSEFNKNTNKEEQETYDDEIRNVVGLVNILYPKQFKKSTAIDLIENIDSNADQLVNGISQLETNNSERFVKILETNGIVRIEEKKKEEQKDQEPEKPASIDNLLAEYFNTEVNDHLQEIEKSLAEMSKESSVKKQTKKLKEIKDELYALKELSMIHGYSGFEHITTAFAGKLDNALKGEVYFNTEVFKHFKKVLKSLSKIDTYVDADSSGKIYNKFNEECDVLITLLTMPAAEEKEEEKVEEETIPEKGSIAETAAEEELIAFDNNEKIYSLVSELLIQSAKTIKKYQTKLKNKNTRQDLFNLLNTLENSSRLLNSSLSESFWQPLTALYNDTIESGAGNYDELNTIWDKFSALFTYPLDMDAVSALFKKESADLYAFEPEVMAATFKKYWLSLKSFLPDKYLQKDEDANERILYFFNLLLQNITLFKVDNYKDPIEKIKEYFTDIDQLNTELVNELDRSLIMILERLELNGINSNCNDILEILAELFIKEEVPSAEEEIETEESGAEKTESVDVKEEQPEELSEEEEVEKIFLEESGENAEKALKALENFKKSKKRSNLNTIENEIHTIKSSASLLNKQKIVDITNSIEDVAELFGQSSIPFPENLTDVLEKGLHTLNALMKDENTETEEDIDALDSLLDQVVIDETAAPEKEKEISAANIIKDEETEKVSENVDDELLEIFKQESEANIIALEDTIKILKDNPEDKKALNEFESSIHSLKSAAKMLGFKEIGQLSDSIESVFEELKNGKITDVLGFCASMTEAINIVKNLSIGEEVNAADLAKITAILDNKDFPEVEEAAEETLEEESAQTSREDGRFKDVFIEEASDLMEQLNADALKLEKKPGDASVLNNILRNLHTLKGSALMSGYEKIGELSHKLEDYLEIYGAKDNKQKAAMLDPLFDVLDILQDMLDSLAQEGGTEMIPHLMTRLAAIDNQIFQIQDKSIAKDSEAGVVKPALKPIQTVTKDGENVVKVSTAYLDALVNMSTELVVNRTELSSHIEKLKELIEDADLSKRQIRKIENKIDELFTDKEGSAEGRDSEGLESPKDEFSENLREFTGKVNNIIKGLNKLSEELDRDVNRIDTVSKVLHHDILKARMVPISTLFARYPKAVRDLARKQGKKINLNISDNNAELDRAMVSALSDPILHILRNAVDHGIETPEERAELNKGEEANIAIIARQEKSQVIIDIIDDGRGIDIDKIKETIIKNDLASAGEVAKMSEAEVLDYIFHSGFSTKDSISNVSGRGIGLDVVASQIQKLKGNIRVRTEKNIGTTFSLRVPLTLTISQALLIRSQGQILALPIFAVKETIEFAEDSIVEEDGKKFIKVRGSLLPYVQLDELLKFGQAGESEKVSKVLVISDAGINIALGVTEVINRQEIVIKTLGSLLQNIDYISGGTILGNGEVCLILDYALIVRTVEVHTIGGETDVYALKSERKTLRKKKKKSAVKKKAAQIKLKKISGRKPRIMIVDDSRSVLNFVSAILDDNNMEPIKSSSGIEALEQIDENDVDLLITDLEMPKMHGFELVQSIRKNNKFDQLPIIILTGRDTKADREKAKEYGANAFINKPFKERDLLKVMEQFIQIVK